jgi:hypothetical protein
MIKTYKVGNWSIEENGIKWVGNPDTDTLIPKDELLDTGPGERKQMYDWLVHLTSKTWFTIEDSRALLSAFLIAIKIYEFEGKVSTTCFLNSAIFQEEWQRNEK